jgi:hypothetical protein
VHVNPFTVMWSSLRFVIHSNEHCCNSYANGARPVPPWASGSSASSLDED